MNKKMIGAILGTFALGSFNVALADDAPPAAKDKKAKKDKKGKGEKGGAEKSCKGADGKGCSGDKAK